MSATWGGARTPIGSMLPDAITAAVSAVNHASRIASDNGRFDLARELQVTAQQIQGMVK